MIDDEEITETDDYSPEVNEMLKDTCYVIEQAMTALTSQTQISKVLMWFGMNFNINLYFKDATRHSRIRGTCPGIKRIIKPIMKKMKRDFPEDEYHHGYFGWLMTSDELQELHDLLKKHIRAPFV